MSEFRANPNCTRYFEEAELFKSHSKSLTLGVIILKGVAFNDKLFSLIGRKKYDRAIFVVDVRKVVWFTFLFFVENSDIKSKVTQGNLENSYSVFGTVLYYFSL